MNDTNERSVASDGSVACEPAAWAVVWENDERFDRYTVSFTKEAAMRHAASCPSMKSNVIALYRSPTLTDAEREAVIHAMAALDHVGTEWTLQCAATLRGLLERMK